MKEDVRIKDLKEQSHQAQTQLHRLADRLNARKTDTVVALLNEGLDRLNEKEWPRPGSYKVSRSS